MNFLRRRLFAAYGMLLVFLGGFPGQWIGQKLFPARHTNDAIDAGVLSQASIAVFIASALLIAFVIFLHLKNREAMILNQRARSWLIFTYGAYAIGLGLGIALAIVMR